jgi:hypothetical protein
VAIAEWLRERSFELARVADMRGLPWAADCVTVRSGGRD